MSANAAAPAAAAEAPKSKKKGKQNDGINNRLQIVMRCARVPLFPATRPPATAHGDRIETRTALWNVHADFETPVLTIPPTGPASTPSGTRPCSSLSAPGSLSW